MDVIDAHENTPSSRSLEFFHGYLLSNNDYKAG